MTDGRRIWFGDDAGSAALRTALWPLSVAFGVAGAMRRALYGAGLLPVHEPVLPCVSVGNLTVGGTGKTPVTSWLAGLLGMMAPSAVVLRDYGGDESEVHRRLNPDARIVVNADRVAGVRAARDAGARVVVLDDAFQHRRIARVKDVVLLSVEQLQRSRRLLPAGPWREPLSSAGRADLLVLTRKSASASDAARERDVLTRMFPQVPCAVAYLAPRRLERVDARETRPLEALRAAPVLAIAGIGEPEAFREQLEQLGAQATLRSFRDHHAYTAADAAELAGTARDAIAVCTLKDAVKLAPVWPASRALWYVSQHVVVEEGAQHFDRLCNDVLKRMDP